MYFFIFKELTVLHCNVSYCYVLTSTPSSLDMIAGPRSPMMTWKATQVPMRSPMILISTISLPAPPNVCNAETGAEGTLSKWMQETLKFLSSLVLFYEHT